MMIPHEDHKTVVVTGASSGIGLGTVQVLTRAGYFVFGSVRKQSDADRLQELFTINFAPLLFDICDAAAIERGAAQARASFHIVLRVSGSSGAHPIIAFTASIMEFHTTPCFETCTVRIAIVLIREGCMAEATSCSLRIQY